MNQPAEDDVSIEPRPGIPAGHRVTREFEIESSMGPSADIVLDIVPQHPLSVAPAANKDPVQAFRTCGEHPSLGECIGTWGRQEGSISIPQIWPGDLPTENSHLMPKHDDLKIRVPTGPDRSATVVRRHPTWGGMRGTTMLQENKGAILNRLKTVRGHLDGIVRMVEEEAYCVELMKQISAVQASLERANRLVLKNHLETCFSDAVKDGRGDAAISELVDAVKFSPVLTGTRVRLAGDAAGEKATAEGSR